MTADLPPAHVHTAPAHEGHVVVLSVHDAKGIYVGVGLPKVKTDVVVSPLLDVSLR